MAIARWPQDPHAPRGPGWSLLPRAAAVFLGLAVGLVPFAASAQSDVDQEITEEVDDALLREGASVYDAVCSSCHQPGGVGLAGRFPPLRDNSNLTGSAYISDVIRHGRQGEITVDGVVYDGVMPAQSSLSDSDVDAVIAYIQSGFAAPEAPVVEVSTGPVAGTQLPLLADYAWIAAFAIAAVVMAMVLGPRVVAASDRRALGWVDAWMKTAVIAVTGVLVTTYVPARVLESSTIQDLPRALQDLIAVGLWGGGILVMIAGLWFAYRERRI